MPPTPRLLLIDPDTRRAAAAARAIGERLPCRCVTSRDIPTRLSGDLVFCDTDAAPLEAITRLARRCHPRPLVVTTSSHAESQVTMWILAGAEDVAGRAHDAMVAAAVRALARRRRALEGATVEAGASNVVGGQRRLDGLVAFLHHAANTDALTGLANRRAFEAQLAEAWRQSVEGDTDLTVVMIDVDHFKGINDRYGHARGDRALVLLGEAVRSQCRRHDLASRLGGDEFALLLPGATAVQAGRIAERVRKSFQGKMMEVGGAGFCLGMNPATTYSLSAGVACRRESGAVGPSELVKRADEALYDAKRSGRGCVRVA